MTEFQPNQPADAVDKAIKFSLKTERAAKKCAVLWFEDILHRKLYLKLGYSTINQYARQELGFSKSRTGDFLQLCRVFKELPKVKAKVESGELGYTSARVLAGVANKENEKEWVNFALNHPRRELEKEVKLARKTAVDEAAGQVSFLPAEPEQRPVAIMPVFVNLKMTPTQFARYEALWEQVRKQRSAPADKVEALLEIMGTFVDKRSPRGDLLPLSKPPAQIHIHQCPDCEKETVQTSRGELEISKTEMDQALCDCIISKSNERNKASITPSIRQNVLTRARYKCQSPGCHHTRFLEVHHKRQRAAGGSNDPDNLMVLCSACHGLLHSKNTGLMVKSPTEVYHWKTPNPHNHQRPVIFKQQSHYPVPGAGNLENRPFEYDARRGPQSHRQTVHSSAARCGTGVLHLP